MVRIEQERSEINRINARSEEIPLALQFLIKGRGMPGWPAEIIADGSRTQNKQTSTLPFRNKNHSNPIERRIKREDEESLKEEAPLSE
jgi:hypothetical protein